LNSEIKNTQREILFNLGEVAEFRSKETGNHVRRVSEYTYILAKKYGIFEDEAERLKMASPMHDIGKLGIPDNILGKPGKLTDEEFEIMKTHTTMGQKIMMSSERDLLRIASVIAAQHHEKFNGKGYPNGLKGHEIHIYGRLVAVADVFDALLSSRVYKTPWTIEDVVNYFESQKNEQFDAKIVEILVDNIEEFISIHNNLVDKDSRIISANQIK
jgi:response regulator RpfG family c-di-GMP phosphodiesterase